MHGGRAAGLKTAGRDRDRRDDELRRNVCREDRLRRHHGIRHEIEGVVAAGVGVIYPPLHRHRVRPRLRQRERVHVTVDSDRLDDVAQRRVKPTERCVRKPARRLAVKVVAVARIPVELVKHRAVGRTQRAAHHRAGRQHRRVREVQQSKLITPRHPGDGQLIAASRQRQQWVGDVRAVGV